MTATTLTKPSLSLDQFPKRKGWYWVPTEWILKNTTSSVDYGANFDWQSMMKKKCSDTGFMHLVRSIQERGWLSAIGWDDGWITEGHHRLCAAILLCMDEIPCTVAGTEWYANKKNRQGRISSHGNLDDPEGCYL